MAHPYRKGTLTGPLGRQEGDAPDGRIEEEAQRQRLHALEAAPGQNSRGLWLRPQVLGGDRAGEHCSVEPGQWPPRCRGELPEGELPSRPQDPMNLSSQVLQVRRVEMLDYVGADDDVENTVPKREVGPAGLGHLEHRGAGTVAVEGASAHLKQTARYINANGIVFQGHSVAQVPQDTSTAAAQVQDAVRRLEIQQSWKLVHGRVE